MKKVFVCSPYGGDVTGNTKRAIEWCREEIEAGNVPFAPHLLYPQILDENNPEHRALGIRMGIEILKDCHELLVCGEKITSGMGQEIIRAVEIGIPIRRRFV